MVSLPDSKEDGSRKTRKADFRMLSVLETMQADSVRSRVS